MNSLSLSIHNKYGVGACPCCSEISSFLEFQYWKYGFFRKNADYDFYHYKTALQDNYSLGKRPVLHCRITARYSAWTSMERKRIKKGVLIYF